MVSINKYSQKYIDNCRAGIERQMTSYQKLVAKAHNLAGSKNYLLNDAIKPFEADFFNNLLLVLEGMFCHRSRTLELKDGNPLNEVRVICNSIMQYGNVFTSDKSIKLDVDASVLKYNFGDVIQLKEENFMKIASAFFLEIEQKYL